MTPDLFIQIALQYLGAPYRYGGNTPQGLDCSGLAEELLSVLGINPPGRQSAQLLFIHFQKSQHGRQLLNEPGNVGDLAFFGQGEFASHIGILISPTHMIEARGGDRLTITLADAVARNAFVCIRPVKHREDLLAIIRPTRLPWG